MYSGDYHNEYAMSGEDFQAYRRQRSPFAIAFWTSLIVSLLTILSVQFLVLPALKRSQQRVVVPQLAGLSIAQATKVVGSMDLRIERMARQADKKPAGTVLSHVPLPGRRVSPLSVVRVIVSLGPGALKTQPRAATSQANTAEPSGAATKSGQSAPAKAARQIPKGYIRMPRLTRMSLARAKRALRRAGLRLRHISFGSDEDKSPHWVLRQRPRAYKRVPRGSAVDLTINRDDL